MKKLFLGFMILMFANIVSAQSVFYIKGSLGPSWQKDNSFAAGNIDYDPSGIGAVLLTLGLNIGPQISTELEFSTRNNDVDSIDGAPYLADLDSTAVMLNGIYKVPLRMGYSFTMGAGFGVLTAELYDSLSDNYANGSAFATQFMFGLDAEVTDNLTFSVEYKRISTIDLELSGTSGVYQENFDFRNGSVLAGLKYNF